MEESLQVLLSAFAVSASGGLAALLRTEEILTKKKICSSILNSGFLGLAIALLWYTKFQENLYFLVGICVIAGLAGQTAINTVINTVIAKGGVGILFGKNGMPSLSDKEKK